MDKVSGIARGNLSAVSGIAESDTARLVARARAMMVVAALTTVLAIAAVVAVIGYRIIAGAGAGFAAGPVEERVALPKGAHVLSVAGSSGRFAVMMDIGGALEMRVFDVKTLKETGRLHFAAEP